MLPSWVYDLLIELQGQQDHPRLLFTSGAFEGYAQYEWCPCAALRRVPPEVLREASAIAAYLSSTQREGRVGADVDESTLPASSGAGIHGETLTEGGSA